MKGLGGFTIVELMVTITVIGILASIIVFVPIQFLTNARDQERTDDIQSIARDLEQSYVAQVVGAPTYPSGARLTSDISGHTGTVERSQPEIFQAPGASTSSIVVATSNSATTPISGGVTLASYVYQPLTITNALCTVSTDCVRFNLFYKKESDGTIQTKKSIHQQ
jgi:prepilin-type N-terminal cleavage/methylation domain-containing protein